MGDNRSDVEIEKLIRASLKMTDVPSPELNRKLKAALYQQEAVLQKQPVVHKLSLWYLPMVFNLIFYIGLLGVLLTVVGLKRADIKEEITIRVEKRGVLA